MRPIIFLTDEARHPNECARDKGRCPECARDKPVEKAQFLSAFDEALNIDAAQRPLRIDAERGRASAPARLRPRERQVLDHVAAGRLNKQIAADLGVVEDTVKMHRGRAMRKLGACSARRARQSFMLRVGTVTSWTMLMLMLMPRRGIADRGARLAGP